MKILLGYANRVFPVRTASIKLSVRKLLMIDWEKHKIYIIIGVLIGIVLLYFLQTWYVKSLVKDELKKIGKERKKKHMKMIKHESVPERHVEQMQHSQDMDSYIDPGDENGDEQDEPEQRQYQQKRLSQDDVLLRDMVDGSQTR